MPAGKLAVSKAVSLRVNSTASTQVTCWTGCRSFSQLVWLGFAFITRLYSAWVTSYLPTQEPEGSRTKTMPMVFVIWAVAGPGKAAAEAGVLLPTAGAVESETD